MNVFVVVVSAVVVCALPARAGDVPKSGGQVVVIAASTARTVAVALKRPADFVSVALRVVSDQKNSALAYEESRQAIQTISSKAAEQGGFRVVPGVASLSEYQGKLGLSWTKWGQSAAETEVHLLVPLTKDRDNIFAAGVEVSRFVEGLHLGGKARCEIGRYQLAVEDPEQYRAALLGQIAQEIRKTRQELFGSGRMELGGLEGAVLVRQTDDRNVELFLNYSLWVKTE